MRRAGEYRLYGSQGRHSPPFWSDCFSSCSHVLPLSLVISLTSSEARFLLFIESLSRTMSWETIAVFVCTIIGLFIAGGLFPGILTYLRPPPPPRRDRGDSRDPGAKRATEARRATKARRATPAQRATAAPQAVMPTLRGSWLPWPASSRPGVQAHVPARYGFAFHFRYAYLVN